MAEDKRSLLQRFIIWREKNIKEKRFILILSFLVGIFTAFAALILKVIIHWIQNFLTDNFNATEANYLYLVYPVVGIFLTGLFVRYVVKDDISHGVTKILYAISRRQGRIKRHNTWSSIIASSITIGFGGSVGAEAPIVLTGSAIGSNLGTIFKMEHRTLMLLVGCGAAGAVAGIFKAPIAGLVFTLEVLMIDLTMSSLLPLLISAVTAATVSYIVTGTDAMFKFHLDQAFELERIPYVIMLGIFCGLVSLYFTRAMNSVEGVFGRLRTPYKKLIMGGAMLNKIDGKYKVYAIYRLMEANAEGDNLWLEGTLFPLLRQQTRVRPDDPFLCLSDFVRPLSSGIKDTVGGFATTIDPAMEEEFSHDDYQSLLIKTLGERLAEAAAEKIHETLRKEVWGYAKDEKLTMKQLLNEDYQGIRPAVGYPSLPDISVSFLLDKLIDMKRIGIHLTENGMMQPHASVCGLMFAHPASRYFSVGKIDEEQLMDYASRRKIDADVLRKYLATNLQP